MVDFLMVLDLQFQKFKGQGQQLEQIRYLYLKKKTPFIIG